MEKESNGVFAEKLKGLKLNFKTYGDLPIGEDVVLIQPLDGNSEYNKALYKQWEKLIYIQRSLGTLNKYIQNNQGEKFGEWLKINQLRTSDEVYKKLHSHNNETGGISAYFFNLQTFYDEQEALYDNMEASGVAPADFKVAVLKLREERGDKRKTRGEERKIHLKDMKKDGKGYLYVELEEPPVAEEPKKTKSEVEADKKISQEVGKINKSTKNLGIYIAGTVLFVAIVVAAVQGSGDKPSE